MPTYRYECKKCAHIHEIFHAMSANPRVQCEVCGGKCKRLLGTGAGVIFKGSGFYETDYKRPASAGDKTASEAKPEAKTGAKTDSKGDGKSDKKAGAASGKTD